MAATYQLGYRVGILMYGKKPSLKDLVWKAAKPLLVALVATLAGTGVTCAIGGQNPVKVDLDEQELCCAVLNACGTAQGEAALAVANSFLGSARAVVAMGSDVEGASAAIFAGEFYENVFANPLDLGVDERP